MDYSSLTDETLFRLIARTKPDALDELYNRYNRMVFGLALNLVGDRATAEEITLDVFTRVWERAETYRPDRAKVSTWLISITRYQSIDVLRRRGTRPEQHSVNWSEALSNIAQDGKSPEQMTEAAMRRERILEAVSRLPDDQKQVLSLAYFAGYTHSQIAEALNQPLGTVKTRIRLAMQKLRRMLEDE